MLNNAIIAIAKDENLYLDEWITYYHNLGFSHIYIWDNNDVGDFSIYEITNKYEYVTVLDVRGMDKLVSYGMQTGCYRKTYAEIKDKYDWIGIFDIDEFLYIPKTLDDFLHEDQWNDTAVIHFNWKYYGDNGLVYYDPRPVQERFTAPCPTDVIYNDQLPGENYIVKSLVRGKLNDMTILVHSAYHPTLKCKHATGVTQDGSLQHSPIIDFSQGYVKHYGTKTLEEYIKRRCYSRINATGNVVSVRTRLDWFFNVNQHTPEKDAMVQNFLNNIKISKAVIAIAKDENLYLDEWITYYHNLGFSHIYIGDNNEVGDSSIYEVTEKYDYVTVIDVRGRDKLESIGMQEGFYRKIYDEIKNSYDWIGIFDIDEFLYVPKPLDEFLQEDQWGDTAVIRFNWMYYGDNDLVHYDDRPVQERFNEPCIYSNDGNQISGTKYLVRGKTDNITIWVHSAYHPTLKCKHAIGIEEDGRYGGSDIIDFTNGYVKHYGTKTLEEYIQRRCTSVINATDNIVSATERINWFFNVNGHTPEKTPLSRNFGKSII